MLAKIGIRPVIDGRQFCIRESLEVQTMNMAKAAAELITSRVRHASGEPLECVIADTTIGGIAESAACADKFRKEGVDITLTVTPCWCYGSETMDMDPRLSTRIPTPSRRYGDSTAPSAPARYSSQRRIPPMRR